MSDKAGPGSKYTAPLAGSSPSRLVWGARAAEAERAGLGGASDGACGGSLGGPPVGRAGFPTAGSLCRSSSSSSSDPPGRGRPLANQDPPPPPPLALPAAGRRPAPAPGCVCVRAWVGGGGGRRPAGPLATGRACHLSLCALARLLENDQSPRPDSEPAQAPRGRSRGPGRVQDGRRSYRDRRWSAHGPNAGPHCVE